MIDPQKLDEIRSDIKLIEEDEKTLKLLIQIIQGRYGDINKTEIAEDIINKLNMFFAPFDNHTRHFVYILIHEMDLIDLNTEEAKYLTALKKMLLVQAKILSPISKMSQEDKITSLSKDDKLIGIADTVLELCNAAKINLN